VDVHPDGRAINYADGILRMRYRDSLETPKLMQPGKVYAVTIEMFPTSLVFKKGHRIRVHVTSSDFPHFDRNLNTGHEFGIDAEIRIASQTLYHDVQYPSHIVLPVIPRGKQSH
jgi:putative CocE/NonD family hydrolase